VMVAVLVYVWMRQSLAKVRWRAMD